MYQRSGLLGGGKMFLKTSILCLSLVLATGLSLSLLGESPADGEDVAQLIQRLSNKHFKVREEAARQLLEREDAAPALQRILQVPGSDPEVARRAAQILAEFNRRDARRVLQRLQSLGEQGEVDLLVEWFVRRRRWAPEDSAWQMLGDLARKLVQLETQGPRKTNLPHSESTPFVDFRRYRTLVRPKTVDFAPRQLQRGSYLARGEEIVADVLAQSLIATSGNFRASFLGGSAVFAGGSVAVKEVSNSVIICDGEFKARHYVGGCIIIARGPVQCPDKLHNSLIVSLGTVQVPKDTDGKDTLIQEKEPNPLGFVKFFDPARAGIEVRQAEDGVRVKTAFEGKRFARAGLKAGDLIAALDGEAIKDPESFRRLLRRKLAEGGASKLKVRRGEKTLEIPITWKD
jgi:hypothetical protein